MSNNSQNIERGLDAIARALTAPSSVVQQVGTTFNAVATGTTQIPRDDTIPQITEGTEFMTQQITPKAATNYLEISVSMFVSCTVAQLIVALFQDSGSDAIFVAPFYQPTATGSVFISFKHRQLAGTTSLITFRVRGGSNAASTFTFNGESGARLYGTAAKSSIIVTEYKP
jgi:hypothetical protein